MPFTYQELFTTNESFATSMLAAMMDTFGTEFTTWSAPTIIREIEDMFHVSPPQSSIDKLMVGINLVTSNSFYTSLPDFNDFCIIMSGEHVSPYLFSMADSAACAWGITEAMLLSPPDDVDNAFTDEIRSFIGAVLLNEGIMTPPDVLKIAHLDKDIAMKVKYEYSDDPEMFGAIFQTEASKTDDINLYIKTKLFALVSQLSELPLKNAVTAVNAEILLKALPDASADDALL